MSEELALEIGSVFKASKIERRKDIVPTETEIIERVKEGDTEAYHFIVDRYMKRAYYVALGFLHNPQDALDISQEAFIKTFRKIKKFDSQKPFFPWFFTLEPGSTMLLTSNCPT